MQASDRPPAAGCVGKPGQEVKRGLEAVLWSSTKRAGNEFFGNGWRVGQDEHEGESDKEAGNKQDGRVDKIAERGQLYFGDFCEGVVKNGDCNVGTEKDDHQITEREE